MYWRSDGFDRNGSGAITIWDVGVTQLEVLMYFFVGTYTNEHQYIDEWQAVAFKIIMSPVFWSVSIAPTRQHLRHDNLYLR